MKVAAFTKYDREAASTRQRVLQYLPALAAAGIEVEVHPLLDDAYVRSLASGAGPSKAAIAAAYGRRLVELIRKRDADLIWVYAELFPWLPAVFEKLAFRAGKPVIYDCDDAFFHRYDAHPSAPVRGLLGGKLDPLIRGAACVCAGNDMLLDHVQRVGGTAILLPTVVDVDRYRPASVRPGSPLTIGWIGSPSTWPFVRPILPLLAELARVHGIRFCAIGAGSAAEADRFDGLDFVPWSEASEIKSVQAIDIGVMPLPDDPWTRGKSGFKIVQYMACGLPVVASPVGVNSTIIVDGVTGILASEPSEWRAALTRLIGNPGLRAAMGDAGRARASCAYSLQAHAPRLVRLMKDSAQARTVR